MDLCMCGAVGGPLLTGNCGSFDTRTGTSNNSLELAAV